MRILHLLYESRGDCFGIGGVGVRAYEIYQWLKDRHAITLLCRQYPGARDCEIDGLQHRFLGVQSNNFTRTLLAYAFEASLFVRRHGENYDVIIEEFSPALPTFLNLYAKRPVVLQIQGYTGRRYFEKYNPLTAAVLYFLERVRPGAYSNIVTVSSTTARRLGIPDKNVTVLPNGIATELLIVPPSETDYLLFLGRIDIHHKGLDILLRAFQAIHKSFPAVRLVIAGDGRDRERFSRLLKTLAPEAQRRIETAGWVEGDAKNSLFRDALAVVVPSRYETQGIVVLEAAAMAKPLILSDIEEFRRVEESGCGLCFASEDPGALAARLCEVLSDPGLRTSLGRRARSWACHCLWERVAADYENYLRQIVGHFGAPRR